MVTDFTTPERRHVAYGLRRSLHTVGAFAAPLVAILVLWLWAIDLRLEV